MNKTNDSIWKSISIIIGFKIIPKIPKILKILLKLLWIYFVPLWLVPLLLIGIIEDLSYSSSLSAGELGLVFLTWYIFYFLVSQKGGFWSWINFLWNKE